jgi:hypothetical protein
MSLESASVREIETIRSMIGHQDDVRWHCHTVLRKFVGEWSAADIAAGIIHPYEVLRDEGNLLVTVGATAMWTALIGGSITFFSNANSYIGVGTGTTAAAAGDLDLTGPSTLRKAMDSTFPTVSTNSVTFRATYGTSDANFAWNEWGVFNASSSGTMLNHKVISLGTKVNTATWQFAVTLSLS